MGELILCNQALAAMPYYLDHASLNVYSLEELGYYIENNLFPVEQDFMNEELCDWVEKELKLRQTAEKLREILRRKRKFAEFILCLLSETGYCTAESKQQIMDALKKMEQKSEFECIKLRGDRYIESQKYVSAICEYRRLLLMDGEKKADANLTGNVWHNMGIAYARLFLFEEAAKCFGCAYELNQNPESLQECFYAYRFGGDECGFQKLAEEYGIGSEEQEEMKNKLSSEGRTKEADEFGQRLEKLFSQSDGAGLKENKNGILELVHAWKQEYQKNCRI